MVPYVLTAHDADERPARGAADARTRQIARVYAEALLRAADEASQADEVVADFEALLQAVEGSSPELRRLFANGVMSRRVRGEVIRRVFEGRAHPLLVNFLLVVNDHDRTALLPVMLYELKELRDRRARRIPVSVYAAVPLSDDQLERIRNRLREVLNLEPRLEVRVDPALLGGLMIRVGDQVFDGTVRTRLHQLRDQLIARSSHEIQSRRDRFCSANGNQPVSGPA
ncbi:MAG: ATP synthase F1 subunit delta [Gemmataceae bacterium]|nr:ATP synthase F1 subunit delta [Gemmataceae bacterium]MDW8265122.1 ATP synthase F1 subunit delta [Gemmataceae bacterium]